MIICYAQLVNSSMFYCAVFAYFPLVDVDDGDRPYIHAECSYRTVYA